MGIGSEHWFSLFQLFRMGGHRRQILLGTNDFGKMMGASQQTASRRLLELASEGYITRDLTSKGQIITITPKGLAALREIQTALNRGFEEGDRILFVNGVVFSGYGEGAYYVTKGGYREQFVERLGFEPFPGTLNLKLRSVADVKARDDLEHLPGIVIKGFANGERSFGDVKCFKALINEEVEGAILMIHRTHYGRDVIEVIASENLRRRLGLKDGDLVQLKVYL